MQLFVTSPDPALCAERLWDNPRRARKMIVEHFQIIAAAQSPNHPTPLKKDGSPFAAPLSRINHPVVRWVRSDPDLHIPWVVEYTFFLYALHLDTPNARPYPWVEANLNLLLGPAPAETPSKFLNFAKCKSKGLDFTHLPVFQAYDKFLEAQQP